MNVRKPRKVRREERARAGVYWTKAERFARSARASCAARDWDPAASNAIHAAINIMDAVCVWYRQERNASGDHDEALAILGEIQEAPPKLRRLLHKNIGPLLSMKNLAEYESRLLDEAEAVKALGHMEACIGAAMDLAESHGWTK